MAPFRHRKNFYATYENLRDCRYGTGDAREIVDSLPMDPRDSHSYDQRYAQSPTAEPLSEYMVRLVRSRLATLFYERMALGFPRIYHPVLVPLELQSGATYLEQQNDRCIAQYSVLLLRTGDDAHLSFPNSFQFLYDSGKALPVNRPDCADDGISVVLVRVDAALEFIFDLIRRERDAIPSVRLAAETEGRQHLEVCEKWVDGVMEHAGSVGIDRNGFTWEAV
ncbi:hypothetical protein GGR53DRAFT_471946 [Hypoxylon sp. FL1150]|nr:hypothetical protein GGR53DRAFT_471946 [Hypoxylon sp. FL1150]